MILGKIIKNSLFSTTHENRKRMQSGVYTYKKCIKCIFGMWGLSLLREQETPQPDWDSSPDALQGRSLKDAVKLWVLPASKRFKKD